MAGRPHQQYYYGGRHTAMKEVIVHPIPVLRTEIHEVPIPIPREDEVVVRVVVAGSNVKGSDAPATTPYIITGKSCWRKRFRGALTRCIGRLAPYHRSKPLDQ